MLINYENKHLPWHSVVVASVVEKEDRFLGGINRQQGEREKQVML